MAMQPTKRERRPRPKAEPSIRFTLEQAQRALPLVRRIVGDIVQTFAEVGELEKGLRTHSPVGELTGQALRDTHARKFESLRELVDELTDIGCELKDAQRGLVDFPAEKDGRPIYLCWLLGEEKIAHWHELETGFAGRQPIE